MKSGGTLAIKLPVCDLPAKACVAVKKMTGLSLADIKSRVANDKYVFVCDYVDDDGLKLINKMKREMAQYGLKARLFEDDREQPSELFDNLEKQFDEINRSN